MSPIATILIVFFTLFLAACGGGSPTSESGTPDTGSGDGSSVSPGTVDPVDPTSPNVITNIGFGSGVGQDFKPGEITLDNSYSLLAGTLQVSVNVVDKDSANAAVAQDYQFEFSSTCSTRSPAQASFSVSKFGSASGSAATTYRNISCRDSDTLTVKLLSKDGSKELATAKVDVPAYVPQLGFGSGAEYIDGKINGQSILLIEPSTILKANAVDVANINELISDENYTAIWRSSCAASTFSITSQNLASGSLVTRYDANSCKGVDVVTLTVYATKNLQVALDSISMNMQVGPVVDNAAVPVLSNLTINSEYVLAGSSLEVAVKGVDSASDSALSGDYIYQFLTSCVDGSGSFESALIEVSSGEVSNVFNNKNCTANDGATLTVNLFVAGADVENDAPINTLSTTFKTAFPQLGFGSGADFVTGKIEGNTNLIDNASTKLTVNAVDVLNLNSLIDSDNYVAQWSASCAAATFSIESQSLSTSNIVTRYDANSCKGNDTVTVKLFAKNDLITELNSTTLSLAISSTAGVAVDAKLNTIVLSNDHALAGESLVVSVQGIDVQNDRALLTNNYVYRFESSCSDTSFAQASIQSNTGDVTNTYRNTQCGAIGTSATDTLTVKLYDASDLTFATALDTKTITINTSYPKLGFGSGADFVAGKIEGNTNLIDTASTKLTVNAVDILNLNSLINSDNYVAQWSANCSEATFSIESQSLSTSQIVTRYDANSCTGNDTVTVKLFAKSDLATELNRTTLSLTISNTAGVAVDAKLNEIVLSSDHALAGESLVLNIRGFDVQNDNEPLTDNYVYVFDSSCSGTSFAQSNIQSNTGDVTNTYRNTQCGAIGTSATDTLTVKLYDASDLTFATALDTKTITINTSYPKLGFGSGADFVDGLISGQAILVNSLSSKLSANAIDALNLNTKISGDNYSVVWSSSCIESSFSITSQSLVSGSIDTRYDANSCVGTDIVTLSLYARNDLNTRLDHTSLTMNIGDSAGVAVEPKIGFGNGSDFSEGSINLSADYVLAGSSVTIIVNGVNSKDNNTLLDGNYFYKFESSCTTANNARFSSAVIANNNGTIYNTYDNRMCQAEDTITVSLFSEGSDTPLTTASAVIATALPKLGYKSGADFIEGIIEGNYNLVDAASTFLSATVIDPLNVNSLLNSSNYYIEWQASCASAKFSIESQSISSLIKTRYDGDADLCSSDTVTLTLFNQLDDELDSITASISINESLIPVEPVLGRGLETTFTTGKLDFSETDIAARQTIEVAVNIVDSKNSANTLIKDSEYAVNFDSVCVRDGRASFDKEQVRTTSGIAKVYYTASGCTGSDTISAVLYPVDNNVIDLSSSLSVASDVITIQLPQVNSIEYQNMSSRQIALKGISFTALPEVTEVNFVIKDEFNQPISGKEVTFSLSNASVDATLSGDLDSNGLRDGKVVASTNASGIVTAYVNSGKTHGLVSVLAVTEKNGGGVLRTQSFGISITTGIPVQPSFSLALDNYNPRGWNVNGETVKATVQLADRFHNPVPDGTVVNFLADGGIIEPQCETSNGTCFVTWRSADPRPGFNKDNGQNVLQKSKEADEHPTNDSESQFHFNRVSATNRSFVCGSDDSDVGCDAYRLVEIDPNWNGGRSGLVTILAYVEGEVDFADSNGNGRYDDGESFSAMSEAYLDANEDGEYTAPSENNPFEQLIEYVKDGVMTAAPPTYQGGSCTEDARREPGATPPGPGHCASLVHLREEVQLVMSSDTVAFKVESTVGGASGNLTAGSCINVYNEEFVTFNFAVSDYNGNIPINETGLTFSADGFNTDAQPNPIGNSPSTKAVSFPITIRADDVPEGGFVRLYAEHPDNGESGTITIGNLTDDPSIKITTTDYLMDLASGPQILEFVFTDACGKPPADNDLIIFEVEGVDQSSFSEAAEIITDPVTNVKTTADTPTARASRFQINAKDLTSTGAYRIQIAKESPATGATEGKLTVRTINFGAGGLETSKAFEIGF